MLVLFASAKLAHGSTSARRSQNSREVHRCVATEVVVPISVVPKYMRL